MTAEAYIGVPVAPVWTDPSSIRPIDEPALRPLPDIAGWRTIIDGAAHLDLLGRAATQALLGEKAVVVSERGPWSEIRLPAQPSSLAEDGYPGWVRTSHLVACADAHDRWLDALGRPGQQWATIRAALVVPGLGPDGETIELSLGTELPLAAGSDAPAGLGDERDAERGSGTGAHAGLKSALEMEARPGSSDRARLRSAFDTEMRPGSSDRVTGEGVALLHPDGRVLHLPRESVRASGGPVRASRTGAHAALPSPFSPPGVDERDLGLQSLELARGFFGKPYFWAGLSGYGVDCSGLVHLSYRMLGVRVPRDADDQSAFAEPVSLAEARPGDAIFFENATGIHHVGLALGDGRMLHSPKCDRLVSVDPIASDAYNGERITAGRFHRR